MHHQLTGVEGQLAFDRIHGNKKAQLYNMSDNLRFTTLCIITVGSDLTVVMLFTWLTAPGSFN